MDDYKKLLDLSGDSDKELDRLKDLCETWMIDGHTEHMTKYGQLSGSGHGRWTDAQKLNWANVEYWVYTNSSVEQTINGKRAQADLLDSEMAMNWWGRIVLWLYKPGNKLRREAEVMSNKRKRLQALKTMFGLERNRRVLMGEIKKLEPKVLSKYNSYEDSERDNWRLQGRALLTGNKDARVNHLCLSPEDRAELGAEFGRDDMMTEALVKKEYLKVSQQRATPQLVVKK